MCRKWQQVCHGIIPGAKVDFWSTAWLRLSHGATFSTESAQKLKNVDCKTLSALRDRLVPIAIRELCGWAIQSAAGTSAFGPLTGFVVSTLVGIRAPNVG